MTLTLLTSLFIRRVLAFRGPVSLPEVADRPVASLIGRTTCGGEAQGVGERQGDLQRRASKCVRGMEHALFHLLTHTIAHNHIAPSLTLDLSLTLFSRGMCYPIRDTTVIVQMSRAFEDIRVY